MVIVDDYFPAIEPSQADDDNKGLAVGHSYGARELWVSLLEKVSGEGAWAGGEGIGANDGPRRCGQLGRSLLATRFASRDKCPIQRAWTEEPFVSPVVVVLFSSTSLRVPCTIARRSGSLLFHLNTSFLTTAPLRLLRDTPSAPNAPPLHDVQIGVREIFRQLCRARDGPRAPRPDGLHGRPVGRDIPRGSGQGCRQEEPVEEADQVRRLRTYVFFLVRSCSTPRWVAINREDTVPVLNFSAQSELFRTVAYSFTDWCAPLLLKHATLWGMYTQVPTERVPSGGRYDHWQPRGEAGVSIMATY